LGYLLKSTPAPQLAIADYHQAFTANIAQWQVQRPLMVHKL
jgi:hypothetical protein